MLPDFNQHLPLPLRFFLIDFLGQFIFFILHLSDLAGVNDASDLGITTGIVISGVACPYNSFCIIELPL